MVIVIIYQDDKSFERWLTENPNGYAYNDFGGKIPEYKVVHKVDHCPAIKQMNANVPKICSANLNDLKNWLNKNRGPLGEGYVAAKCCSPF